jgi:hypothetical protein
MPPVVRRSAYLCAVLALAALGAALVGLAEHTDDGCQVERHCLACRLAVATLGADHAPPTPLAVPAACERTLASNEPHAAEAPYAFSDSGRGPPRAAWPIHF